MRDYTRRIQNLRDRRQDAISKALSVSDSFLRSTYGEPIRYTLESMEPISETYTNNTYRACEKVQGHIYGGLKEKGIDVAFRYQGSVPTNTHIKNYSDIDILVIHQGFYTLQAPQVPSNPYYGDTVEDLKDMRIKMRRILETVYSAVDIDDTGSKALGLSGGSLNREIDLISCNWYNSLDYAQTNDPDYRGVYILDRDKNIQFINYPFMHIYWINYKDDQVNGNEKRLIRLLKTLRSDADDEIKLSSYDIASLVFRMDNSALTVGSRQRLDLLQRCDEYLGRVISDTTFREGLWVANGTRKIFCDDGAKLSELIKLKKELRDLIGDINQALIPLYSTIQKAEIIYG